MFVSFWTEAELVAGPDVDTGVVVLVRTWTLESLAASNVGREGASCLGVVVCGVVGLEDLVLGHLWSSTDDFLTLVTALELAASTQTGRGGKYHTELY